MAIRQTLARPACARRRAAHLLAAAVLAAAPSARPETGDHEPDGAMPDGRAARAAPDVRAPAASRESMQDDLDRALREHDYPRALRIADTFLAEEPLRMDMHRLRVGLLIESNDRAGARSHHREMLRIFADDPGSLNELAWSLAAPSSLPLEFRDPEVALAAALRAADLTGRRDPAVLDTLASVYHAIGLTDLAVDTQNEALARVDDPVLRREMEAHLDYMKSAARARQSLDSVRPDDAEAAAGPAVVSTAPAVTAPPPSAGAGPADAGMHPVPRGAGLIFMDPGRTTRGDL